MLKRNINIDRKNFTESILLENVFHVIKRTEHESEFLNESINTIRD